jgi:hypothetical protein
MSDWSDRPVSVIHILSDIPQDWISLHRQVDGAGVVRPMNLPAEERFVIRCVVPRKDAGHDLRVEPLGEYQCVFSLGRIDCHFIVLVDHIPAVRL